MEGKIFFSSYLTNGKKLSVGWRKESQPIQNVLQTKFFKIERRTTMITYYNRTRMTAVPTELLQDTNLSVEARGFAAILYAIGDEGVEMSELACQLNMPEERILDVLRALDDTDYLRIRKEGDDAFCLELRER